jgi:hypothetical protein
MAAAHAFHGRHLSAPRSSRSKMPANSVELTALSHLRAKRTSSLKRIIGVRPAGLVQADFSQQTQTKDRTKMSDRPSHNIDGVDLEIARRI